MSENDRRRFLAQLDGEVALEAIASRDDASVAGDRLSTASTEDARRIPQGSLASHAPTCPVCGEVVR